MSLKRLFIVSLGLANWVLAVPKDTALTDEAQIRLFELSQEKSRETLRMREAKREEFLDRSRLGGDGDSCLAYSIETGGCAISAAEFDRGLAAHLPDSLELQSGEHLALIARKARRSVFESLLDRAFLDAYRREDSLRHPSPAVRKNRAEPASAYAGYDMPTLLKAFPRIRAQVVAASDSAWLAARLQDSPASILPVTLPAWELPDTVAALLARYPLGEWTPILRVPFGFLACAWLDSLPEPALLAEIRPRLNHPGRGSDARQPSRTSDALRKGDLCRDEDTLQLSLRLSPSLRRPAQAPGPSWSRAHSAVLPASVKGRVWTKFAQGKPDTLGPIRSDYGTWMIALSSQVVRPGRKVDSIACLARAEAKTRKEENAGRIRSELEILASKRDSDRSGDVRTALLESLSGPGGQPESSYQGMREDWVSRSLRFTRDMDFLDPPPETGNRETR